MNVRVYSSKTSVFPRSPAGLHWHHVRVASNSTHLFHRAWEWFIIPCQGTRQTNFSLGSNLLGHGTNQVSDNDTRQDGSMVACCLCHIDLSLSSECCSRNRDLPDQTAFSKPLSNFDESLHIVASVSCLDY